MKTNATSGPAAHSATPRQTGVMGSAIVPVASVGVPPTESARRAGTNCLARAAAQAVGAAARDARQSDRDGRAPLFQRSPRACAAFTMVEIAICLGVIGFALVAIIGVLPTGMNVQKENREETIVNQDTTVLMNAIRGGAQGLDDLTNYVVSIVNTITRIPYSGKESSTTYTYYPNSNGVPAGAVWLTNGAIIVGLLSTPKIIPYNYGTPQGGVYSNHVVAVFRSLSGSASDKTPQTDATMLDLAFTYRVISEMVPFCDYNTNWAYTNWNLVLNKTITTNDYYARAAYLNYVKNLTNSLYDVRLTFRWPQYPGGSVGPGRQVFRAPATGTLVPQMAANTPNPPPATPLFLSANQLYYFHPSVYAIASP